MAFFSSIWHKYLGGRGTPWADVRFVNGKMSVEDHNDAFTENLRSRLGDLTTDKTDEQVIDLFVGRENIQYEEPYLDVKHSGIDEDGRVKMEMDWNTAFIRHLKENGIEAETEEEAVQKYLSLLTSSYFHEHDESLEKDAELREQLESETRAELDIAAQQLFDSFEKRKRKVTK
jgi:hypothetical protein